MLDYSLEPVSYDARPLKIIRPPRISLLTFVSGIASLCTSSDLLYTLTALRLSVRYKQSVLGWIWAVIQPLSLMIIYTLVFTRVLTVQTGGIAYPVFAFAGLLPWLFFATAVTNATTSLVNNSYLLTRVSFPREMVPISYVAAAVVDFLIASFVLAGLMLYYRVAPKATIFLSIPIIFFLILFGTGVSLLLAALHARFRDIGVGMPLLLQVWMFATPIVYPLDAVPARFRALCLLNPLAGIVDGFRRAVLQGLPPEPSTFLYPALSSIVVFIIAYIVFKNLDANMADVI